MAWQVTVRCKSCALPYWHNGSLFSRYELRKTILMPFKAAWQFFVVERSSLFRLR